MNPILSVILFIIGIPLAIVVRFVIPRAIARTAVREVRYQRGRYQQRRWDRFYAESQRGTTADPNRNR